MKMLNQEEIKQIEEVKPEEIKPEEIKPEEIKPVEVKHVELCLDKFKNNNCYCEKCFDENHISKSFNKSHEKIKIGENQKKKLDYCYEHPDNNK